MDSTQNKEIKFFLIRGNHVRINKGLMDSLSEDDVDHLSEIEKEFFKAYKERGSHFSLSAQTTGTTDQEELCRSLIKIVRFKPKF